MKDKGSSIRGDILVKRVDSPDELKTVFSIREKVFVEEQEVEPELEYDEYEDSSRHFIAFFNDTAVGTARWRKIPNGVKLERFAVLQDYRNNGIGTALVKAVLQDIPRPNQLFLHAQLTARSLYEQNGFEPYGDEFMEAGIRHVAMKRTLK